jgi:cell division protein FtsX
MAEATWKPSQSKHGKLDAASTKALPDSAFAFSKKRKEPMTDASHVRNAIARFDQVEDVTDEDREEAFANIRKAAKHYGIEMHETSWHELGSQPRTHKKAS